MSRSKNSKRGCWRCCKYRYQLWDDLPKENYRLGKQNKKRNRITFYGNLYKHKMKKNQKLGYPITKPIWDEKRLNIIDHKYGREKYSILIYSDNWKYKKYVLPAKESYINWFWLKGKPNKKGMNHKILRSAFIPKIWL